MYNGIIHSQKEGFFIYQYVFGGFVLFILSLLAKIGRELGALICSHVYERITYTAEFTSEDESFRWISAWISSHPSVDIAREISIFSSFRYLGPVQRNLDSTPGKFVCLPLGWSALRHRGHWMLIMRHKRKSTNKDSSAKHEIMRLQIFGGSRSFLVRLLEEAKEQYEAEDVKRTNMFMADGDGEWNKIASKLPRALSSVSTSPAEAADNLLRDCSRFLDSEEWYASKGIPWRRGYLLYGLPGTGKTSLVCAIAGELKLPIYIVALSSPSLIDEIFSDLLNCSASKSILLLEDIDAAFQQRSSHEVSGSLTFSGLLNGLDGVAAQEGRLLFMTTNHRERLDPALIRPGRVDVELKFSSCVKEQVRKYVQSFFDPIAANEVEEFCEAVPPDTLTIAELQSCLLLHREDRKGALAEVKKMVEQRLTQPSCPATDL